MKTIGLYTAISSTTIRKVKDNRLVGRFSVTCFKEKHLTEGRQETLAAPNVK